jgi:hypothetical protein
MNEHEFGRKIREHLNYGSGHLRPDLLRSLEAARGRALAAFQPAHEHALEFAGAGVRVRRHPHHPLRWLSLALLLAALAGGIYWQQEMSQDQDVDAALLSGDLPVDAYLDHGFQAWLERSSQR